MLEGKKLKSNLQIYYHRRKKGNHMSALQRETGLRKCTCVSIIISKKGTSKKGRLGMEIDVSCR